MSLPPCKYRTGKTLGQGTYAVVKEVFHVETGERYAAKVLNKSLMRGREHLIRNEILVLSKVSKGHPNIVSLMDYFETTNNLYLVMELATGGELFDRIWDKGTFYEMEAAQVIKTVLNSVKYLHDQGIVHRDLKPENLIYKSKDIDSPLLVADFGLAKVIDPDQFYSLTTTCGTPGYMAPEIYLKTGYGKPVDMWAIGVICYFLLSGEPPFHHQDPIARVQAITSGDYNFNSPQWMNVSELAKHFIQQLLIINPHTRMTCDQALTHQWLTNDTYIEQPISMFDFQQLEKGLQLDRSTQLRNAFKKTINVVKAINAIKRIDQFPIEEEVGTS
ncbi:putative calmodulin-dependent protein kinase type 1 [Neoconidiobolus thromboides FSU 785]|nr:putative calmodulin-dependent protein kinase type 1 [Neoconidiobolus thromboides FSU 785]